LFDIFKNSGSKGSCRKEIPISETVVISKNGNKFIRSAHLRTVEVDCVTTDQFPQEFSLRDYKNQIEN